MIMFKIDLWGDIPVALTSLIAAVWAVLRSLEKRKQKGIEREV